MEKFVEHINRYHKTGTSIHDESGHYFTVNKEFRKKLKKIDNNEKKIYEKFYDKTITTDMITTVSNPEIKNAIRMARI